MSRFSRRAIVKAGAAGVALGAIPLPKWLGDVARADPPAVRYSCYSVEGKARLVQYAQAVAAMKLKGAGDPCSWTFQWFTHWVRGNTSKPTQIGLLPVDERALATEMWDTCQNHGGFTTEDMFLPWHRMFLFYFERIARGIIGDSAWTLPYWNYNAVGEGALPPEFLQPANGTNPLWSASRNAGPNSGAPLTGLNLDALAQTTYSGFCSNLDFGLHGDVHVKVGNAQGMGQVPWAANDPIFWMHHCNIDRLWASWNAAGNTNPTDPAWTDQPFTFANANCKQVVAAVGNFTDIAALNYTYDRLEPAVAVAAKPPSLTMAMRASPLLLKGPGPVTLGRHAVTVELKPPAGRRGFSLGRLAASRGEGKRIYLVVGDLMAHGAPGVVYNVSLSVKSEARRMAGPSYLAGEINFFAADMPPGSRPMKEKPGLVFDVTGIVEKLDGAGDPGRDVLVTISPDGTPDREAMAMVGEILFIEA